MTPSLDTSLSPHIPEQLQQELTKLRESEQRLNLVLQASNLGFFDLDIQTGEALMSQEDVCLPGDDPVPFRESLETRLGRIHPDDRASVKSAFDDYIAGHSFEYRVEFRQRTPAGTWMWTLSQGKIVERDTAGAPLRMLGTHSDISVLKNAEEKNRTLQSQLMHAKQMESVGRLAGGVAHDFNNMLAVILGHTETALDEAEAGSALAKSLEQIRKAAERSATLTRQLLAFARRQTFSPGVLQLNKLVEGRLGLLARQIGNPIRLEWKPAPTLCPIFADPDQLEQILLNLCLNARDAIQGKEGCITLSTSTTTLLPVLPGGPSGEYVVLSVADNGSGIKDETLPHIFEPFFTTKELGKGSGLGLATVYGIVEQNQGHIRVESTPGKGATFHIHFLRHIGKERWANRESAPSLFAFGHETILLVDDEPTLLNMTRVILEKIGYTILTASDPAEAVQVFTKHFEIIDLLLSDVMMPGMNGCELYEKLLTIQPELRVLYMSGYPAEVLAEKAGVPKKTPFISKPFTLVELSEKIRNVLETPTADLLSGPRTP